MNTHASSNVPSLISPSAAMPAIGVGNLRSVEQLVKQLWRRRLFIAVCGICFGVCTYLAVKQIPKRYTAEGQVAVDTQRFMVPELQGLVGVDATTDTGPQVRSETLLLRSSALLRNVVDDLGLAQDPEFNPALRPPGFIEQIKGALTSAARLEFLPLPIRGRLLAWGFLSDAPTEPPPLNAIAVREGVMGTMAENLAVFNDGRSLVISVSFTSESPERASEVVNKVFDRYLGMKREGRALRNREGMTALQQRLTESKNELNDAERQVREFRALHGLVSVRAGSVSQQQVEDLTTSVARASDERARIGAIWDRIQSMPNRASIPMDIADVLTSQTVSKLRESEVNAVRRVADLSSRLGPNHPERRAAEAELGIARAALSSEATRIVASVGEQFQSARQREAELNRQLVAARAQATQLSAVQAEAMQLEKDSDTRRALYQSLMQRVEQSAGEPRDPQVLGVQVVSFAVPPIAPSAPRPALSGGIGLFFGLCVGGLLTVMQGQQRGAFRDLQELAEETRLPVLAAIPRVTNGWGAQMSLPKRVIAEPNGPEGEALRGLRAQLRFMSPQAPPRSVAFTAAAPGESSAAIAAAFARVAALDGLRVLLIEGNLPRPTLVGTLSVSESNGLMTALRHDMPWAEAVVTDATTPLDLLLVAEPPLNALQLLEGVRFQQLLASACEEYNLVVVNAPAVTQAAETMMLAHCVDAIVLVVEAGVTPRHRVITASERLRMVSAGLTAAVFTKSTTAA